MLRVMLAGSPEEAGEKLQKGAQVVIATIIAHHDVHCKVFTNSQKIAGKIMEVLGWKRESVMYAHPGLQGAVCFRVNARPSQVREELDTLKF